MPIVTIDRPPRTKPIRAEVRAISRREMPLAFMMAPARMNSGTAIKENFTAPSKSVNGTLGRSRRPVSSTIATTDAKPSATAIGTSASTRASRPSKTQNRLMRGDSPASPQRQPSTPQR